MFPPVLFATLSGCLSNFRFEDLGPRLIVIGVEPAAFRVLMGDRCGDKEAAAVAFEDKAEDGKAVVIKNGPPVAAIRFYGTIRVQEQDALGVK